MIRTTGLFLLLLLKVLGWALLILLALFLLFVLLVLFVPVRYQVQLHNERSTDCEKHNLMKNVRLQLQVHWLLHLLQISASYGSQGFQSQIRAAGIDIPKALAWLKKKKERRHNRRQAKKGAKKTAEDRTQSDGKTMEPTQESLHVLEETRRQEPDSDQLFAEKSESDPRAASTSAEKSESDPGAAPASGNSRTSGNSGNSIETISTNDTEIPLQKAASDKEQRSGSKTHKRRQKKKNPFPAGKDPKPPKAAKKKKRQETGEQADPSEAEPGFFARLRSRYAQIRKEIKDETNRYAVGRVWAEFLKVIRSCRPRKLRADISFSLADPAFTGLAVGHISLLPWIYRYPCSISPDFTSEQMYVEGEIFAQGKVSVYVFVLTALRLLRDKKFMRTVRRLLGRGR